MTLETSPFRSSLQRASVESTRTPHESLISPLILNLNLTCDRNNTTVSLQENMNLLYYRKSIKNAQKTAYLQMESLQNANRHGK